ncbi:MAG: Nucleotidyltransferase domain protein [Bacteroidetes bacterium ADurb.Bin234]|nr:MAG: Nucleotidyltransferase domain protein [Bacteroidetes bacterium ADurb.Bin234]
MVKAEVIELLNKYISLLNSNGIAVYKAFLFGSYSTDTANEASDIDVMLVSENNDECDDEVIGKIWRLTRMVSTKIEPLIIGKSRYDSDDNSPLIEQIKTQGIELTLKSLHQLASEPKTEYKTK